MQETVSVTELHEILSQKLGKNEDKTLKVDMEKGFRSQSQCFL